MNLFEISQPSDALLLESFQNDPSGYSASDLLQIYRAYITEVKNSGMKPKGFGIASVSSQPQPTMSPGGIINVLKIAGPSIRDRCRDKRTLAKYDEFKEKKVIAPSEPVNGAGNDKPFTGGGPYKKEVHNISEFKLDGNLRLVYVNRNSVENNKPVTLIHIFGIYTHDELGIGTPPRPIIANTTADKFAVAVGEKGMHKGQR